MWPYDDHSEEEYYKAIRFVEDYAVSLGDVKADQDLVGTLAAEVVSEAVTRVPGIRVFDSARRWAYQEPLVDQATVVAM